MGPPGPKGDTGAPGIVDLSEAQKTQFLSDLTSNAAFRDLVAAAIQTNVAFKDTLSKALLADPTFQTKFIDIAKNDATLKSSIVTALKADTAFMASITGPAGPTGPKGDAGSVQIKFPKTGGLDSPAIQVGDDSYVANDNNLFSLGFGKQATTNTGMGLVTNSKKRFTNTTGAVLGTHIAAANEWSLFSDGWNNLATIQGGSGNAYFKGDLASNDGYFKTWFDAI
ncbi:MAG: hypothetical protein EHM20_09965, partial [Alphaproteobacteria bacterium]